MGSVVGMIPVRACHLRFNRLTQLLCPLSLHLNASSPGVNPKVSSNDKNKRKMLDLSWVQSWSVTQTHGCNDDTHNTKQTNDDPNHCDVHSCGIHVTMTNLRAPQPLKTFVTQPSSVISSKPCFDTLTKSPSQTSHLHAPWIMSELNKLLTHCLICHRRWMLTWGGCVIYNCCHSSCRKRALEMRLLLQSQQISESRWMQTQPT